MRLRPLLAWCVCSVAAPLSAQTHVELAPTVGLYVPTAPVADQPGAGCGGCQVTFKQEAGFFLGGRLTIWTGNGHLGLETSLGFANSSVHGTAQGYFSGDTTGTVGIFTERLLWAFTKPGASPSVYAAGGLAYLTHSSDAYQGVSGTSNLGAVLGLGARFPVGGGIAMKTEFEDLIYSTQFDLGGGQSTVSKRQNDLLVTVGMSIKL